MLYLVLACANIATLYLPSRPIGDFAFWALYGFNSAIALYSLARFIELTLERQALRRLEGGL